MEEAEDAEHEARPGTEARRQGKDSEHARKSPVKKLRERAHSNINEE